MASINGARRRKQRPTNTKNMAGNFDGSTKQTAAATAREAGIAVSQNGIFAEEAACLTAIFTAAVSSVVIIVVRNYDCGYNRSFLACLCAIKVPQLIRTGKKVLKSYRKGSAHGLLSSSMLCRCVSCVQVYSMSSTTQK